MANSTELKKLLCGDGKQLVPDESMKVIDAVQAVLELYPSASKLALCTLANLLTKPSTGES